MKTLPSLATTLALFLTLAFLSPQPRAAGPGDVPGGWAKAPGKRVLYFTKSAGFEHSVVKRGPNGELSHSEKILQELGQKHGFSVTCTKDGTVFTPENIANYDVFVFYTSGDLLRSGTDKTPGMTAAGKEALLEAIKNGKGFVGLHSATDSFHFKGGTPGVDENFVAHGAKVDPFIAMLGGEFIRHGPQQVAKIQVIDGRFPGCEMPQGSFEMMEEWYTFKDFAPDMHVIHVLETKGMNGIDYQRASFPYTWARMHGQGRVFYTGLAHREDVWSGPLLQNLLLGGIGWAARNVDAEVTPNLRVATPGHAEIQPKK